MAKTTKKSTRKFEKNNLKDTIERRKQFKKIKQRNQITSNRKARSAKDRTEEELYEDAGTGTKTQHRGEKASNGFEEMTVDEFFQGGFEVPKNPSNESKRKAAKPVVSKIAGKRKRTEAVDDGNNSDSAKSLEADIPPSDSASSFDEEADFNLHKEQIEGLKKKDPDFYKFLKENDGELLEFGEDGGRRGVDLHGTGEEDETGTRSQTRKKRERGEAVGELGQARLLAKARHEPLSAVDLDVHSEQSIEQEDDSFTGDSAEVSIAMVKKWTAAMAQQHSLRSMREVVLAFRAAVHVNEDDNKEYKYTISSPEVYHELLLTTLQNVPEVLKNHLPVKETTGGKIRVPTDSKKYRSLVPLLKSHSTALCHLLTTLSDAATLNLTLSSIIPILPYLLSFKKIVKNFMKIVVGIWSEPSGIETTRINAFLAVRRLVIIGDAGIREGVLKTVYQGLVKGSRNTTVHTVQGVNLMKNSAAELWGIDPSVGYTTGFSFIRQLAVHLRGSITNNAKDSYKDVYNWQFVHSLDFWSRVLSVHCESFQEAQNGKESALRPLIYPTVQLTLGSLRLIPSAQYFPLRFQLIRSLLRLSLATGTYIPLVPALLEVLNSVEMRKPPKASTIKALDFTTAIRAPKSYLRTRVYQEGVGEQVVELMAEFFVLWTKSIAFPELALPAIVMLKRWLKDAFNKVTGNKNNKVNSALALLVQKLETNSRWIEERRAKVDFAPNDRAGVEDFLKDTEWEKSPLGAFVAGQRRAREEKAKLIEIGRKAADKRRQEDKEQSDEEMADAPYASADESGGSGETSE